MSSHKTLFFLFFTLREREFTYELPSLSPAVTITNTRIFPAINRNELSWLRNLQMSKNSFILSFVLKMLFWNITRDFHLSVTIKQLFLFLLFHYGETHTELGGVECGCCEIKRGNSLAWLRGVEMCNKFLITLLWARNRRKWGIYAARCAARVQGHEFFIFGRCFCRFIWQLLFSFVPVSIWGKIKMFLIEISWREKKKFFVSMMSLMKQWKF